MSVAILSRETRRDILLSGLAGVVRTVEFLFCGVCRKAHMGNLQSLSKLSDTQWSSLDEA